MATIRSGTRRVEERGDGVRTRPFSVEDYHRMIDANILGEDDSVELLEGTLYEMSPQGEPHARALQWLVRELVRTLPDDLIVRPQLPLTLEDSEPEPDVAVVRAEDATSRDEHPRRAVLVVEIAHSSLEHDRTVKARVYARAGVPELWIVDLEGERVETYNDPDPAAGHYATTAAVQAGDRLRARSLSDLRIDVRQLFD